MKTTLPRPMSSEVRPIEGDVPGTRWRWMVYDDPHECFVRSGRVSGDRAKAERAAQSTATSRA